MACRPARTQGWFDRIAGLAARLRRAMRAQAAAPGPAAATSDATAWREFESLIGEAFRLQGYQVTQRGDAAPHRDFDLTLRRDRQTFLVRCKEWQSHKVGVDVVQRLHGVMTSRGAAGAFVVTAGRFSREASAFAGGCSIRLIEGTGLQGLLRPARAARTGTTNQVVREAG